MKETLLNIAETVSSAEPILKRYYSRANNNSVVARVNGEFDGKEQTYWFLSYAERESMYGKDDLKALGYFVHRNSRIATMILNNELGASIDFQSLNNIKRMQSHHLVIDNRTDLENRTIALAGDQQLYSYVNIHEFLAALRHKEAEIAENERLQREQEKRIEELKKQENTAHERSVLTKGLNKLQEEYRILTLQQEEMRNLTKYIRKQGQLRFNPNLDPVQNRIKTQNLFDGTTIIVDGGPGTGKTTTMIQRLKYLTDIDAIEEDFIEEVGNYKLSASQRDNLFEAIKNKRDWMFFSPSALLKEYLADAMNREGLIDTSSKVWHWQEYCKKVIRDYYHLIDLNSEKTKFKSCRSSDLLIYQHSDVINAFNQFFLEQLRAIKNRLPKISDDTIRYKWISIALNIRQKFEESENSSLQQFVSLLNNLEMTYASDCRELLRENRETVKRIAEEIAILLSEDEERKDTIEALLTPTTQEASEYSEEEIENDTEEEDENYEENLNSKVLKMIRDWFKRYCYSTQNKEIKLTSRQEKISELLLELLTEEHKSKVSRVGELVLFEQYAKYTRGVSSILFGQFHTKYKRFRRLMLTSNNAGWNQVLLKKLVKERGGKDLHYQEQALLIGFINNLVKIVLKSGTKSVNHVFVDAYNELSRPIIGIDEATDFCECDIYAIQSLLTTDYNSLTICGDMMQRLTKHGITNWSDIYYLVSNPLLVDMRTSYRQSSNLLDVASQLYSDTIGEEPNYKPFMKSKKVPKPLAYISNDEYDKIEWIERRIKEVYIAYGKVLPSIAIFLNNKQEIPQFVEQLKDTDFIADAGIDVVDGSAGNVLSNSNHIRVYPIDVVKGMEFDVVFFHNIDSTQEDTDLLKRYIYVGVSRAAFFLGVTFIEHDENLCKYFSLNSTWDKI